MLLSVIPKLFCLCVVIDDLRPGHTEQEPVQETGEHQNMDSTSELKEQIMDSSGLYKDSVKY